MSHKQEQDQKFQSTPLSLAETTMDRRLIVLDEFQSTPLSLAETFKGEIEMKEFEISIHSAIASGDVMGDNRTMNVYEFQSTPLSLAETHAWTYMSQGMPDFNPLRYR